VKRIGRPQQQRNQQVVNLALGFYARFSQNPPSGTATGKFAEFARAFYAAAAKRDPGTQDGLERQIREAMKRLDIERQRAERKSALKSGVLS
jgi:hypothetical protein